jgi:hypothetical protein
MFSSMFLPSLEGNRPGANHDSKSHSTAEWCYGPPAGRVIGILPPSEVRVRIMTLTTAVQHVVFLVSAPHNARATLQQAHTCLLLFFSRPTTPLSSVSLGSSQPILLLVPKDSQLQLYTSIVSLLQRPELVPRPAEFEAAALLPARSRSSPRLSCTGWGRGLYLICFNQANTSFCSRYNYQDRCTTAHTKSL